MTSNCSFVSAETTEAGRPFHGGIVRGRIERLKASVYIKYLVDCELCEFLLYLNQDTGVRYSVFW